MNFFDVLLELDLTNTLGIIPPLNPLKTIVSLQNNLDDPQNFLRKSILDSIQLITEPPVLPPSADPLDSSNSDFVLCFSRFFFPILTNQINNWAEDIKYGCSACSDTNDSGSKTNHKFKLFFEYARLLTKRYFFRTRESPLMNNYLGINNEYEKIIDLYSDFRQHYFFIYYNNLRNIQFDKLFTRTIITPTFGITPCGWLDVRKSFIDNIFQPLRNLTITNVTYDDFLNNLEGIIINLHNLLITDGTFPQFILTTYPLSPFYGQNVCDFDDLLNCLYSRSVAMPNYNPDSSTAQFSIGKSIGCTSPFFTDATYFIDEFVDYFNLVQNNTSILSSVSSILFNFILHILEKFVRYKLYKTVILTPTCPSGGVIGDGADLLTSLLSYFIGNDTLNFIGLFHRYSYKNGASLGTADINYILGVPSDSGASVTGILRYIITKLRDFLTLPRTTTSILIRPDNNIGLASFLTFTASNSNSFFTGTFIGTNWIEKEMAETTVTNPPRFGINNILAGIPTAVFTENISMESNILNLLDEESLACCLKSYVLTHLNILENLNVPTSNAYFTPSVTVDLSGNIISYDGLVMTDIFEIIAGNSVCPKSVIDITFKETINSNPIFLKSSPLFSDKSGDEKDKPIRRSIKDIKYYCIAIINYILFSICRQTNFGDSVPPLDLSSIVFTFDNLSNNVYFYGNTNSQTIQLLYQVFIWHELLFNSFYGTNKWFDPINLPDQILCTGTSLPIQTWTTTPLIKNFFFLEWKYNSCFLDFINTILKGDGLNKLIIYYLSLVKVASIQPFPYERINNLERVSQINYSKK